ncbi:MAG: sugar transferase [Acidobacteria bacterium]|nr:sugar transferase [Acidobacteriota bacterium]
MVTATSKIKLSDQTRSAASPARRVLDLLLAIPAVILLLPVFVAVAIWIKLDSRGPIFFLQERVGMGGRPFRILKFRTMVTEAEQLGTQITVGRDPRITRSGHFLRQYRFDELPQLFNVLKGEMSIVGPRPEVPCYVACYNDEQRQILAYRPGITSPATIEFSNESEVLSQHADPADPEHYYRTEILPAKLAMDLNYSRQATVWSDCTILARTILRLIN